MGPRGLKPRRRLTLLVASLAVVAVLATGTVAAAGVVSGKIHLPDPWARLSDAQKQAVVDQAHARNAKYLNDFEARRGDPRTLPIITIDAWQPPPPSFGPASAKATAVVRGIVREVHFTPQADGGIPQMTAMVEVLSVGRGSVAQTTIRVRQMGGPVAQGESGQGALVRLDGEELILPGDEVVLLLLQPEPKVNEFQAVYGAGVYFVRNGILSGEAATRYGFAGRTLPDVWPVITQSRG